jgi:HEAT repeat protein
MTDAEFLELLSRLDSSEAEERVEAIQGLAPFARYLQGAVEALIDALQDPACVVRAAAVHGLGQLHPPAAGALAPLIDALKDPMPCVRVKAAEALSFIRPDSQEALESLSKAVDDPEIACMAIEALGAIGPPAKAAIAVLLTAIESERLSKWAARALGRIGPDAKQAVPLIARFLESRTISDCRIAAEALGRIGPAAIDAVPLLVNAFRDRTIFENVDHRNEQHADGSQAKGFCELAGQLQVDIALAIWRIWQHPLAIYILVDRLHDPMTEVRLRALAGLREVGSPAAPATADIANLTRDADPLVRSWALTTLASAAPAVRGVLPLLVAALRDSEPIVRSHAADAIGGLGSAGDAAVDGLLMLLDDADVMVRLAVAAALWRVARHKAAITGLVSMLDERSYGSEQAAMQLATIGPPAYAAVPALFRAGHSSDIAVRWSACYAIECIVGLPNNN